MLVSKQKSQPSFQLFAANNKQMCTKTNFLNFFLRLCNKKFSFVPAFASAPGFCRRPGHVITWLPS